MRRVANLETLDAIDPTGAFSPVNYRALQSAAIGLLADTCERLNELAVPYVVVGGWSPFFLNGDPIGHPGSKDVDVLFAEGATPEALGEIIEVFLEYGYLLSAKHNFQLLKELTVSGVDFVFNVDLLHPSEGDTRPEMFADHLVLPVPATEYRDDSFTVMSIVIPESTFIFDGHVVDYNVEGTLPHGSDQAVRVPLMDEVGTIATKAASCRNPKRPRDAFDIYLAIEQARDYAKLVDQWRVLRDENRSVYNLLFQLRESALDESFGFGALRFLQDGGSRNIEPDMVRAKIQTFLRDVGLEDTASQR